jgi:hypothetical protein
MCSVQCVTYVPDRSALKLRRFFFCSKTANASLFYPSFIPTVSKTVRPERAAVWKTAAVVAISGSDDDHDHRYHYLHDSRHSSHPRHAHHRTTPTPIIMHSNRMDDHGDGNNKHVEQSCLPCGPSLPCGSLSWARPWAVTGRGIQGKLA